LALSLSEPSKTLIRNYFNRKQRRKIPIIKIEEMLMRKKKMPLSEDLKSPSSLELK